MYNLVLVDDGNYVHNPFNVALATFKVVDTGLLEDKDTVAKLCNEENVMTKMSDNTHFLDIDLQQKTMTLKKRKAATEDVSTKSTPANKNTPKKPKASTTPTESPKDDTETLKKGYTDQ